ncbi:sulfatase-like hydrolase/transferase [Pokkaliibacter sp. CJK22405]|uniref:sulfatase-like hydrolase/transferase n=1 Tax=Pokkaliibacter sp. CJK22405 TaxID=3384615 RepID=UPI00398492AC
MTNSPRKPNLLVLVSDEHQAQALSIAGHPIVKTPHLDALAARGKRFTNAYTNSPICVPARAAFATGQYVHQLRLWDNAMPYIGKQQGWGHGLQAKGVPVESIGKLHYRDEEDPTGFDRQLIPMNVAGGVGMIWASIRGEDTRMQATGRMLGDYIGPGESPYTRYDRAVVEKTVEWLKAHARPAAEGEPWCLYVGLVAPHFPLIAPKEFYDLYGDIDFPEPKLGPQTDYKKHPWVEFENQLFDNESGFEDAEERRRAFASYYGLCTFLDHNVGLIMAALEAMGLTDSTTVVYTTDHGENLGTRGMWGKGNLYEESAKIPMIMAGPNVTPGICETPVSLVDLSETIMDHFAASVDTQRPGTSLYQLMDAPYDKERVVFSEYHAIGSIEGGFMVRKGDWKYIHYVNFEPELFNLADDPEELVNLADKPEYRDALLAMRAELEKICSPEDVNRQAHQDQQDLVNSYGGLEAAAKLNAVGVGPTPPPAV